jgi:hypothetical protein
MDMLALETLDDHPELAGMVAELERRGRVQMLMLIVKAMREDPGADFVELISALVEREAVPPGQIV